MGRIFNPQPKQVPLKINPALNQPQGQKQSGSNDDLQKYKNEVDHLKEQNQALISQAQQALEQYKVKIGELSTEKQIISESSEKESQEQKRKIKDLVQKNKSIAFRAEKAIEYFRTNIQKLIEQNKSIEAKSQIKIQEIQNQLDDKNSEYNKLQRESDDQYKQYEIKIAELSAETQALSAQNNVIQKQSQQLVQEMEIIKEETSKQLQSQAEKASQISHEYEKKIEEIMTRSEAALQTFQIKINSLNEENQQLKGQVKALQNQIGNMPQPIIAPIIQPAIQQPIPSFNSNSSIYPQFGLQQNQPFSPLNAWSQQSPTSSHMPIMGERRFEISDDLRQRLQPLPQNSPSVSMLRQSFSNPSLSQLPPFMQNMSQPIQTPPTSSPIGESSSQIDVARITAEALAAAKNRPGGLSSDVQVLISQLSNLASQADSKEISKDEFDQRLQAALKTIENLTGDSRKDEKSSEEKQKELEIKMINQTLGENSETKTETKPKEENPPNQELKDLSEENKNLLEEMGQLKNQLGTLQEQAQMSEKEKDSFKAKLAESLKALRISSQTKQQTSNNKEVVKISTEEFEPEAPRVKLITRKVAKGSIPPLTNTPNVINGLVKDARGLILSDVIIVVKDTEDNSVRALKTNKLGQFAISTPLPNGTYNVELEKDGYNFDIIQVEVMGEVLPPLEIRSH